MTRKERIRRKVKRIVIGLGLLVLVSVTAYGGERARGWALADGQFPVERIVVTGTELLAPAEVEALLDSTVRGANLLRIDTDELEARIRGDAWIESVRVKRLPPDRLEINIKERKPRLLSAPRSDTFYDGDGVPFPARGRETKLDLPILVNRAGDAGAGRIAALFAELDQGSGWIDRHAAEIVLTEDGGVTLIDLERGTRLLLGAGPYYGMRERIETTWRQWNADGIRYAEMDLRFRDQIVVRGPIAP